MRFENAISIEDPADPRLAPYASIRERDLVGRQGRFIVEGEVTLRLMLSPASRFRAGSILLAPERLPGFTDLIAALPEPPPVYCASKAVMGAVAGFPMHRGVLALGLSGEPPAPGSLIPPAPAPAVVLGLVGLTNHDNVGGLFRNAAAFGADAVLLDDATCDPLYRKAIRVSAGAALTMPFARTASPQALLGLAARHDLVRLAMTPGAEGDIADAALPSRSLVLLGSEGPGLPPQLMAECKKIRIGMAAGFDSLNVATAGAIALHHLLRRRRGV
ncbi:TrmH family RNA methyltransferase [Methylobacterium haplocladii]|uniref:RNA methyltransferase n=1 Tax=Methylobacterium haplocladii TaxID=1176176 RepID=A0A512IUA3_9HYPH|nr:RNA methyltransferase [Methylobacterium haplocladii]GEP01290.1 RNA methyltransferase [Methylobacterium haplocladii]GJD86114.1 23S rRNA (guanosine-2'-O-)-methyltransferase RlmB [Methylobacterium haplocladii]GLS60432.1 RNA methyltransferase [Methylobacterium haplocladii]